MVQCKIGIHKVRIINGYGTQEDDLATNRLTFWQSLEQEIVGAKNSKCMVLIQMDANAKVGKNVISSDPNDLSDNGWLLLSLIDRENLILANSSPLCNGAIARHRVSQKNVEKSILDYILVCEKLGQFLEIMQIDEKRDFPLTKYASKKGNRQIVKSDHNTLYGRFSIKYRNLSWKRPRKEMFNLKNNECQQKFTEVTNKSTKLKN